MSKTYSIQINRFGVIIICGDTRVRNSYSIVFTTMNYNDARDYQARNNHRGAA